MTFQSMRYCLPSQKTVNPMMRKPLVLGTGASADPPSMPTAQDQQLQMCPLCLFLLSCRHECG